MRLIWVLLVACAVQAADLDIKTFGATGNGKAMDTAAIQKAIDAANAAGGGVVHFPSGRFLSGTLKLTSNVALYPSPRAVLFGRTLIEDYNPIHRIYPTQRPSRLATIS